MELLARSNLYQQMFNDPTYSDVLHKMMNINLAILAEIEQMFLSQDSPNIEKADKDPFIVNFLKNNIQTIENTYQGDKQVERLCKKLSKLAKEYENKDAKENQNARLLFNKIINELGAFNEKQVLVDELPTHYISKPENMPQIFLSHAYDDRLFALALFHYFYNQNIYLFVDWMHNGEIKDGRTLKSILEDELRNSEQLLFLRTLNSELDIQGKHMLRSWCAWELGNFHYRSQEKYLINLYSVDKYENRQLHGLMLYTGIVGNRLNGTEILPTEEGESV